MGLRPCGDPGAENRGRQTPGIPRRAVSANIPSVYATLLCRVKQFGRNGYTSRLLGDCRTPLSPGSSPWLCWGKGEKHLPDRPWYIGAEISIRFGLVQPPIPGPSPHEGEREQSADFQPRPADGERFRVGQTIELPLVDSRHHVPARLEGRLRGEASAEQP